LLYEEERDALVARSSVTVYQGREPLPELVIRVGADGFDRTLFSQGGSCFSNDAVGDPHVALPYRRYFAEIGVRNFAAAALRFRDHRLGELHLGNRATGFGVRERRIVESVACLLSVAVESGRIASRWCGEDQEQAAERRRAVKSLRRLHRVSREIGAALGKDRILSLVLEEAARASGATHGNVMLRGTEAEVFRLEASLGYADHDTLHLQETLICGESEIVTEALEIGGPLVVSDARSLGRPISAPPGTCSALTVPIFFDARLAGLINLYSTESYAFDDETVEFVQALADQAAVVVGNAQRYEEQLERGKRLHRRADQLSTVLRVSQAFRSDRSLDDNLRETARAIRDSVGFDRVLISVLEGDPPRLRPVAAAGVSLAEFDGLKDSRQPWSVVSGLMSEEFRIGRCYYVPVERQGTWRTRVDTPTPETGGVPSERSRAPGRWDPLDMLLVPLSGSGGDVHGVFSVDQPRDGRVPSRAITQALEVFADQTALAIENSRLSAACQVQAETMELFHEVNHLLTAQGDLDQVLETVVGMVPRTLHCDTSSVFLLDQETGRYVARAVHGSGFQGVSPVTLGRGEGLEGIVSESGRPMSVRDLDADPRVVPGSLARGTRHAVLAPLTVQGHVVGILRAGRREAPEFSQAEENRLAKLAEQVAVAVQCARLFEEVRSLSVEHELRIEERTRALAEAMSELTAEKDRVETLYRITSELSFSLDVDRVLGRALELILEAVGAEHAAALMQDAGSSQLTCRAALEARTSPVHLADARPVGGERLVDWVVGRGSSAISADIRDDPRWSNSRPEDGPYRSALSVPLLVGDEVPGALVLLHTQPDYFGADHLRLAETAAIQVASAIRNAGLYSRIRDQASDLAASLKSQEIEAAKSHAILEGVADGVVVVGADGKVLLVNAAAERMLQLRRGRALGRRVSEVLSLYCGHVRDWPRKVAHWEAEPAVHTVGDYLAAQLCVGSRVLSVHVAPVLIGDEFLGTVSVFRDVTAEAETERAKTEFVSTVSHELRTPITSIVGYVDLILTGAAGGFSQRQREFLTIIRSNADRLTALVNDLLSISRIESGRMVLEPRPTRVEDVLDPVIKAIEPRLDEKGLTMESHLPPVLPPVMADPDRVAQVLTNLMANACQYTPAGGEVIVSAALQGDEVHVQVRDTGIGIPHEDQDKIFNRFFRVDTLAVRETPGTGLGLSIVKALVEMGGGRIWVESELKKGSTFTFSMPVAHAGQEHRETVDGADLPRRAVQRAD
jgi:PAS domain S-box-containing protein